MSVAKNIAKVLSGLPAGVELVAVSKTHPVEAICEAYAAGQRSFGENRPQEMAAKHSAIRELLADSGLPDDIRWHQIGHLQTNKVRLIAPFVSLIQSADSAKLLREIDRQAAANDRVIEVLLEIKIAREASKEGWDSAELVMWLETGGQNELPNVKFRGTMGVATNTDDEARIRSEFLELAHTHATLRERFFDDDFDTLSMGMSSDYKIAADCGSTMVRVGSLIFGARDYPLYFTGSDERG